MAAAKTRTDYDALIVGAGVGGMESALVLGEMGYHVLLLEKEPSVGGRMILLSKVFPTLDCASCISTPKMAAVNNNPNIKLMVYSQVDDIQPLPDGTFSVNLTRKPPYVDPAKCTGCSQCETACTVAIPDEFNYDLAARRAAHIAFPQAVPKKAVITKYGSSPCTFTCPAGVKPHGYVSLVRAGKYEEAFKQHMDDAPFPGILSRACYAPCEDRCTRGLVEGPVPIRGIKRFMSDRYYENHSQPDYGVPTLSSGKRVAVVGSGPAGLSAAYFLARSGHQVTVFEADHEAGGIMRYGIPSYRLPKDVVARDLLNVTALGVKIETDHRVESVKSLTDQGFDSVFVATGDRGGRKLAVPGEELPQVQDAMEFLHAVNVGKVRSLSGKKVVVVGGGNVSIDSARSALRLGAGEVHMVCLESRPEMPAHHWEIQDAEDEGIQVHPSWGVREILHEGSQVKGIGLKSCTAVFDSEHRFRPTFDEKKTRDMPADFIITAIGLAPNTASFAKELELNRNGTIKVDKETLLTSRPNVYAGGDAVVGPSMIVSAIGQGKRAAFYIDRSLKGLKNDGVRYDVRLEEVDRLPIASRARQKGTPREPVKLPRKPIPERIKSFDPYEGTLSEADARFSANRCLDCGGCSQCGECVAVCPASAIDLGMQAKHETVTVGSVVLSTGFTPFDATQKPALGFGRFPNVITGPQMDRILAPTRPYNAVLRPSDGKMPSNVAFVLCVGSRDEQAGNRLCSRVCCMYSMKQAQLLMGALPLADITIYYIDIRAFGKQYEEFFQQTKGMGVNFTKGRVGRIDEDGDNDLIVHYEDIEGGTGQKEAHHDLVILSTGLLPNQGAFDLFKGGILEQDEARYVREVDEELEPGKTTVGGVYAIGAATAVRDIPDTVLNSGAIATQIAAYLKRHEVRA